MRKRSSRSRAAALAAIAAAIALMAFASSARAAAPSGVLNLRSGLIGAQASVSVDGGSFVALSPVVAGSQTSGTVRFGLVSAGNHRLTVKVGAQRTTFTVSVPSGQQVTALVYTNPAGHLAVVGVPDTPGKLAANQSWIVVTDAAQYTGAIDVSNNGHVIASGLTDSLSTGPATHTLAVPAGAISLSVTRHGQSTPVLANVPGHAILPGYVAQVFIVGDPTHSPGTLSILVTARTLGLGYRFVASDGGVFDFGNAHFYGSTGSIKLNKPIVGETPDNLGLGYWLVASDGGIFAFGDAAFHGSTGNIKLNQPIVGMAATPDGGGYWLVASDGGIFAFGDAKYYGSTGNVALHKPIVGMAPTIDGKGYWLVASDGGIFAFGDAQFYGSTGNVALQKPIVGMFATPDSLGYWLVASDGGIFNFGDAKFLGSTGNVALNKPIVGGSLSGSTASS